MIECDLATCVEEFNLSCETLNIAPNDALRDCDTHICNAVSTCCVDTMPNLLLLAPCLSIADCCLNVWQTFGETGPIEDQSMRYGSGHGCLASLMRKTQT